MKFSLGDKVEIIDSRFYKHLIGSSGKIVSIIKKSKEEIFYLVNSSGFVKWHLEENLKKYEKGGK